MMDNKVELTVEVRSRGELLSRLQQITLRGSSTQPYLNARIDLVTLDPAFLAPTQRYVLDSELKKVEQVRWDVLEAENQDIFLLDGYLRCTYIDKTPLYELGRSQPYDYVENYPPKTIDVLPPVIEEYFDPRGRLHMLICDGQHRCYLARTMGTLITVAYVRGIHWGFPYYAYPLPNGWNDVYIMTGEIPEDYIKKFHVAKNHKALYRNFNSRFENIGDSRPRAGDTEEAEEPKQVKELLISMDLIKELREKTGMGMRECKEALGETNGNLEQALDYMRTKDFRR
jgi:hypothetical protein